MPMTLLEQMKSSVTPQYTGYAAKLLGETPANIEKAVALAIPAILSGTASAAHVPSGQSGQSVVSRLVADPVNDGTLLHRLPALYQGTMTAAPIYRLGAQLLQAIFGSKLGKVTQTVAALSGIKPASSALLVSTLAPHILAILGKRHRLSGEATATGLAHLFDAEHASLAAAVPAALSQLIGTPVEAHATAGSAPASTTKTAKPAAAQTPKAAAPIVASQTVPAKSIEHRPTVTKQSYKWSSWLPVLAMYGLGAGGLALLLTSQPETPSPNPVTGVKSAQISPAPQVSPAAPAPVVSAPSKTADIAKPTAIAQPTAPASAPATSPPAKAAEPGKTAEVAKTAEVTKPATPAPAPVIPEPAKTAEPAKPASPAPAPTAPVKTAEAAKPAVTTPAATPPAPVAAPAKGTTSYFGTTPPVAEAPAKLNPDYKPLAPLAEQAAPKQVAAAKIEPTAAPTAAATLPVPVSPKGVTTYFGATPPAAEAAAKMNPDYTPTAPAPAAVSQPAPPAVAPVPVAAAPAVKTEAKPAAPAPTPPVAAPAQVAAATAATPKPVSQPGVTTYFGPTPTPAEQAAVVNPDYRPAPPPAKAPSLAETALAAVTNLIKPVPPRPAGVTTYYGPTPPNQEAAARPNADYKPATTLAATSPAAPAAPNTAAPANAAAPVTAPAADVAACQTSVANAVKKGRIVFQSARAELKSTSIATLDRLIVALKACPNTRLKVEGHTDSTGLPEMNLKLSQARAQTVASYLAAKGIDAAKVTPVGLGAARPVAPNTSALNKARNRRIEFAVEKL